MSDKKKVRDGHSKTGFISLCIAAVIVLLSIQLWISILDKSSLDSAGKYSKATDILFAKIMLLSILSILLSIIALIQRTRLRRTGLWSLGLVLGTFSISISLLFINIKEPTYKEVRKAFKTKIIKSSKPGKPPKIPPSNELKLVYYPTKIGKLAAYISLNPKDGQKHPAIIWKVGGFGNGIGSTAWQQSSFRNDQSARSFRRAGIVTMYPSVRGGNNNPGTNEWLYGEVDDILSAYNWLRKLKYVDPKRIYLGGHSTGGTLVLLVATVSAKFRAIFSLGPAAILKQYGNQSRFGFDKSNPREWKVRSPLYWLNSIKTPTFVIEGSKGNSNAIEVFKQACQNPNIQFHIIKEFDHFDILAPLYPQLIQAIRTDSGSRSNINFSTEGLFHALTQKRASLRKQRINKVIDSLPKTIEKHPRFAKYIIISLLSRSKKQRLKIFKKMMQKLSSPEQKKFLLQTIKHKKIRELHKVLKSTHVK